MALVCQQMLWVVFCHPTREKESDLFWQKGTSFLWTYHSCLLVRVRGNVLFSVSASQLKIRHYQGPGRLLKGQERIHAMVVVVVPRQSEASGLLAWPKETRNNHIGGTALSLLSSSLWALQFWRTTQGWSGIDHFKAVCHPQLIPGRCLLAKQKSAGTDINLGQKLKLKSLGKSFIFETFRPVVLVRSGGKKVYLQGQTVGREA